MKSTFFYYPRGLSESEVELGRWVENIESPGEAYHPPYRPLVGVVSTTSNLDTQRLVLVQRENNVKATLTKLLAGSFSNSSDHYTYIDTPMTTTRQINNLNDHVQSMFHCSEGWILDRLSRGKRVYLCVGIVTFRNAKVTDLDSLSSGIGGKVQVPITAILTHGASLGMPGGNLLDVSLGGSTRHNRHAFNTSTAYGERVFAAQYRELKGFQTALGIHPYYGYPVRYRVPVLSDLLQPRKSSSNGVLLSGEKDVDVLDEQVQSESEDGMTIILDSVDVDDKDLSLKDCLHLKDVMEGVDFVVLNDSKSSSKVIDEAEAVKVSAPKVLSGQMTAIAAACG